MSRISPPISSVWHGRAGRGNAPPPPPPGACKRKPFETSIPSRSPRRYRMHSYHGTNFTSLSSVHPPNVQIRGSPPLPQDATWQLSRPAQAYFMVFELTIYEWITPHSLTRTQKTRRHPHRALTRSQWPTRATHASRTVVTCLISS